ncbi:MAG: hypothetical protein JXA21_11435 [Anaerolineae bacterium]|nr:hypothetical protein [Anaerolineae bacterium]
MSHKTDPGPNVFRVAAPASAAAQMLVLARQVPARRRAEHVREVCQGCADVIALTPMTTWVEHLVVLMERLEANSGDVRFQRELGRFGLIIQGRLAGEVWSSK